MVIRRSCILGSKVLHSLDTFSSILMSSHIYTLTHTHTYPHTAALEALKRKAEPPSEQEFTETYRKCKYGINLISKLGHHLSSPSPTELLRGIFGHIKELVHLNKG